MTRRKPRKPPAKDKPLTEQVEEEVAKTLEVPLTEEGVIASADGHYADLGSPPQPTDDDDEEDLEPDPSIWIGEAAPIYHEVLADVGVDPEQNRLHTHDAFMAEHNQDEWLASVVSASLFDPPRPAPWGRQLEPRP